MFIDTEPSAVSACGTRVSLPQSACGTRDEIVYCLVHQQISDSFKKQMDAGIIVDEPAASTFLDQIAANLVSVVMLNCIVVC